MWVDFVNKTLTTLRQEDWKSAEKWYFGSSCWLKNGQHQKALAEFRNTCAHEGIQGRASERPSCCWGFRPALRSSVVLLSPVAETLGVAVSVASDGVHDGLWTHRLANHTRRTMVRCLQPLLHRSKRSV